LRAVLVSRELIFATRVADLAARAGVELERVDDPADLPQAEGIGLLIIDWDSRDGAWRDTLVSWVRSSASPPRLVLFGPHADLPAARAAKEAGLGPVVARSRLPRLLIRLFGSRASA
jgi:hypothetical protein